MRDELSPFERLRARGLLTQILILAIACLVGARMLLGAEGSRQVVVFLIAFYLPIMIVLLVRAPTAGLQWTRLFGRVPARGDMPLLLVVAPLAMIMIGVAMLFYVPLSYLAPGFVERMLFGSESLWDVRGWPQFALLLFITVVVAPLAEETLFRGILLHRWSRRWGTRTGVLASSALFALGHGEWLGHFVIGVGLALLYLGTRSLWMPILAHGIHNLVFTMPAGVTLVTHKPPTASTLAEFRDGFGPAMAALVLGSYVMTLYVKRYWPDGIGGILNGKTVYEGV